MKKLVLFLGLSLVINNVQAMSTKLKSYDPDLHPKTAFLSSLKPIKETESYEKKLESLIKQDQKIANYKKITREAIFNQKIKSRNDFLSSRLNLALAKINRKNLRKEMCEILVKENKFNQCGTANKTEDILFELHLINKSHNMIKKLILADSDTKKITNNWSQIERSLENITKNEQTILDLLSEQEPN